MLKLAVRYLANVYFFGMFSYGIKDDILSCNIKADMLSFSMCSCGIVSCTVVI